MKEGAERGKNKGVLTGVKEQISWKQEQEHKSADRKETYKLDTSEKDHNEDEQQLLSERQQLRSYKHC